jgi:hypothetical protein
VKPETLRTGLAGARAALIEARPEFLDNITTYQNILNWLDRTLSGALANHWQRCMGSSALMLGEFLSVIERDGLCDQAIKAASRKLSANYRGETPNPLGLIFGFQLLQLDGIYSDPHGAAHRVSDILLGINSRRPPNLPLNPGLLAFAHMLHGFSG